MCRRPELRGQTIRNGPHCETNFIISTAPLSWRHRVTIFSANIGYVEQLIGPQGVVEVKGVRVCLAKGLNDQTPRTVL